jgi:phosphatidylinositol-3-phosphatase
MRRRATALAASLTAALAAGLALSLAASAQARTFKLPKVKHVWVIVLENQGFAHTFGEPAADPYLAQTLPSQGALLNEYFATGHESNDNYISLVSGQPPNPDNQADCQLFDDFLAPAELPGGVEGGIGCVYPATVGNIGTQLTAAGKSWKAYEEDMGNDPNRESPTCGHPAPGAKDETQKAEPGDGYVTRHDPFVYFHSVIDSPSYCAAHVVALSGLARDLERPARTPALSFITPDVCDDGHDFPCTNEPSGASALADVDAFLETWVPRITASRAFGRGGLLMITFDESDGIESDSSACCEEQPGPASPLPGVTGPGGGRVGAVLLSRFIAPGTVSATPYNHYSALASFETLLGLPRLADAASVPSTFGQDVFTAAR